MREAGKAKDRGERGARRSEARRRRKGRNPPESVRLRVSYALETVGFVSVLLQNPFPRRRTSRRPTSPIAL